MRSFACLPLLALLLLVPEAGAAREKDVVAQADAFIAKSKIGTTAEGWRTRLPKPPTFTFAKGRKVRWVLETSKGRVVAELDEGVAPAHVSNIVYLTRLKFYDGLTFHRVIKGFMAQGGCPLGNGGGNPGYGLPLEVRPDVKHTKAGQLSTARSSLPNSDGSQFFITFGPAPGLDHVPGVPGREGYTLFGEVVEGLDVVRAIEAAGAPGDPGTPRERLEIRKASIELK